MIETSRRTLSYVALGDPYRRVDVDLIVDPTRGDAAPWAKAREERWTVEQPPEWPVDWILADCSHTPGTVVTITEDDSKSTWVVARKRRSTHNGRSRTVHFRRAESDD